MTIATMTLVGYWRVLLMLTYVTGVSSKKFSQKVTACKDTVSYPSAKLNCADGEMIHVQRIRYFNGSTCDQALQDERLCGQPLTSSSTSLTTECNGKTSCDQYLTGCNASKVAVVNYRCINASVFDMCTRIKFPGNTEKIYLSSPIYPSYGTFTYRPSPCRCFIRGTNIKSIIVLELILKDYAGVEKPYLAVQSSDQNKNYTSPKILNKKWEPRPKQVTAAEIIFNHKSFNQNQKLWIEITGKSLTGYCNNETTQSTSSTTTSTTTMSPHTTSSSSISISTSNTSPTSTIATTSTSSTYKSSTSTPTSDTPTTSTPASDTSSTKTSATSTLSTDMSSAPTSTANIDTNYTGTSVAESSNVTGQSDSQSVSDAHLVPTIAGSVTAVLGLVLIVIIIIVVCRRTHNKDNPPPKQEQTVHLHKPSPNDFVLELPNEDKPDRGEPGIKADTITGSGEVPEYAVVNKHGRKSQINQNGSSDMEILENDLYIPYEATASPHKSPGSSELPQDMEILENDLYVRLELDTRIHHTNLPHAALVSDLKSNHDAHHVSPTSTDMEILENDLYIPLELDTRKHPSIMEPKNSGAIDHASTTPNDMEILENDLYIPLELDTRKHPSITEPENSGAIDHASTTPNDMEILENDISIPLELDTRRHPSISNPNNSGAIDHASTTPTDMEITENDLYVPQELDVRNGALTPNKPQPLPRRSVAN